MISDAGVLIISSATNEDSLLPTSPRRDKMGIQKCGDVTFSHFGVPGVKKVDIGLAAKYAIWKHLDSSSFKIIAKVAS